jgi:hypothetical protein
VEGLGVHIHSAQLSIDESVHYRTTRDGQGNKRVIKDERQGRAVL